MQQKIRLFPMLPYNNIQKTLQIKSYIHHFVQRLGHYTLFKKKYLAKLPDAKQSTKTILVKIVLCPCVIFRGKPCI
jgi:hypothetical protein